MNHCPTMRPRRDPGSQRGLSLIEVMVGIVVALLVALAAAGSAQLFMGKQRQSVDIGSGAANETNGLAAIKYELSQATLGFYVDGHPMCPRVNLSQGAAVLASNTALPPLAIAIDPIDGSTKLDILYAGALESTSPVPLAADTTGGAASLTLAAHMEVKAGQAIMLVPGSGSASPCTVRTATKVTGTAPQVVETAATGPFNQAPFTSTTYGVWDFATLLGNLQWSRFRVDHGNLLMEQPLTGGQAVMARNVVAFAAEYGVSDATNTSVGSWEPATGAYAVVDAASLLKIRALRVGIVVASEQADKKDATGHCAATPAAPVLFDHPIALADPDWGCHRYRVATVVVPLRNIVLGSGY